MISLLVVDDHPVVRQGVALLLQDQSGIDVIGYCPNAIDAVRRCEELAPDVVLLDLRLPDMLAPEAARQILAVSPTSRILVFTAFGDHAAITALTEAGVSGCLLKDVDGTDFVQAIHRVAGGDRVFDPRIGGAGVGRGAARVRGVALTSREYEVLRRVAMGETNPEIATAIGLTRNTVKAYLQSVLQKLGARNRVEAVVRANEAGIL